MEWKVRWDIMPEDVWITVDENTRWDAVKAAVKILGLDKLDKPLPMREWWRTATVRTQENETRGRPKKISDEALLESAKKARARVQKVIKTLS